MGNIQENITHVLHCTHDTTRRMYENPYLQLEMCL